MNFPALLLIGIMALALLWGVRSYWKSQQVKCRCGTPLKPIQIEKRSGTEVRHYTCPCGNAWKLLRPIPSFEDRRSETIN